MQGWSLWIDLQITCMPVMFLTGRQGLLSRRENVITTFEKFRLVQGLGEDVAHHVLSTDKEHFRLILDRPIFGGM